MYRKPVKRAFTGLAGSPLSRITKQAAQKSDFTVRKPKSPDRTDPIVLDPLTEWIDQHGNRHGAIDEDCSFQSHAFDSDLGGRHPVGTEHLRSDGSGVLHDDSYFKTPAKSRRRTVAIGFLQGEREIKMRRSTPETAWIFDWSDFTRYLMGVRERKGQDIALQVGNVLYQHYYCNREDLDIWYEFGTSYWETAKLPARLKEGFRDQNAPESVEQKGAKEVKNFRQYHVKAGRKFSEPIAASPEINVTPRRALVVGYDFEGHGQTGFYTEGVITRPDHHLTAYIGEIAAKRRAQGFQITVKPGAHTIDRIFPSYKQALAFMKEVGLKPTVKDNFLTAFDPQEPDDGDQSCAA